MQMLVSLFTRMEIKLREIRERMTKLYMDERYNKSEEEKKSALANSRSSLF